MIDLYNADCLQTLKSIGDKSIDLVVTDPPYVIEECGGGGCFGIEKRDYHKEVTRNKDINSGISNDVLQELVRVMKNINIYLWCNKNQLQQYIDFFMAINGVRIDLLTWHKTNPIPTCNGKYISDTEYCLFFHKNSPIYGTYETKHKYYVTQTNTKDKKKYHHPTIKPLHIIENLIINSSKEGDTILDCYMGSGTTGAACKKLNRNFIGIELNKEYFEIAKRRINNTTIENSLLT